MRIVGILTAVVALLAVAGPGAAARPADPAGPGRALTFSRVAGGFDRPVLVTSDGTSTRRLFVVEQTGRIQVLRFRDGRWRRAGVFLDLHTKLVGPLDGGSEQGLLGLAFHPDYATNGRFYVDYTRKGRNGAGGDTVIAEYRRSSALRANGASRRTVRVIDQPYDNHNGGHLAFGPDGYLYIALGDGGDGGDPEERAQDLAEPLGKLLRIDPRDPDGAGPLRYAVPADNPYIGETEKATWLLGVRNPWRFSFDRETGDLWLGDVGQGTREEIDRLPATAGQDAGKGDNLGWNVCEGDQAYPGGDPCGHDGHGFVAPLFDYDHGGSGPIPYGCSVTGGHVIRAPEAGAWTGLYLFGDFCSGRIGVLDETGDLVTTVDTGRAISSFGEDQAGKLYLVDLGGTILRIRFTGDPRP